MMDAARLAEELRTEQETAQMVEKERRDQEARAKDLQVQLDDAETNAIKWVMMVVLVMIMMMLMIGGAGRWWPSSSPGAGSSRRSLILSRGGEET